MGTAAGVRPPQIALVPLLALVLWVAGSCTDTTVTPVDVASIDVVPDNARITEGDTLRLSAVARDAAGNKLVGRKVVWSSTDASVVEVDQDGLVRGVRAGTADVAADLNGLEASARVAVDAPPRIALGEASVVFSAAVGADPPEQSVTVTNAGDGTLGDLQASVAFGSGASGWLTATLSGSTAPATLTLRAETRGLGPGSYSAEVVVAAGAAANSPRTLNVTLELATPPRLQLAPRSASFEAVSGGSDPAARTVAVTNTGGGTLSGVGVSVSYGSGASGWLQTSLTGTTAPATLNLRARVQGLSPGSYSATVAVASGAAENSPQEVAVTFEVKAPEDEPGDDPGDDQGDDSGDDPGDEPEPEPLIELDPRSVTFEAVAGAGDPSARTVAVTNDGDGTLSGLGVSVSYGSGASGWLETSLGSTTAPATLTLRARTGSLVAGTYTATVSVASAVAANSPQAVSVTFEVRSLEGPSNLRVTNESAVAIDLAWDHSGTGVAEFRLERRRSGGSFSQVASISASDREYRDRNVQKATTYFYRLRACVAGGACSEYSNEVSGTTRGN